MPRLRSLLLLGLAGAVGSCGGDSQSPAEGLSISPTSRALSLADDSTYLLRDSVVVALTGVDAGAAPWVVTHSDTSGLTLADSTGAGSAVARWSRDLRELVPAVYIDSVTVALRSGAFAPARRVDTLVIRAAPPEFLTVSRPWRPGERDSLIARVVAGGAWGIYSGLAPLLVPSWEHAVDVVQNPSFRGWPAPGGPAWRSPLAPQWESGWNFVGFDIRIVFDSAPDLAGVQKDSIHWVITQWSKPANPYWHGFLIYGGADTLFAGFRTVKTSTFDANEGQGLGAGESRVDPSVVPPYPYWEGSGGGWKLPIHNYTLSGGYGTIPTPYPFAGGNSQTNGRMGGTIQNLKMPRVCCSTADTPATQNHSIAYEVSPITSTRIRCYFQLTGSDLPAGFTTCNGFPAAALVRAARAGERTPEAVARILFPDVPMPAATTPRRRGRRLRRCPQRSRGSADVAEDSGAARPPRERAWRTSQGTP